MSERKILGVIGGLGPMATAYFMRLVTEMSESAGASSDQDHIETIIYSRPQIPDRTAYILHPSINKSPFPMMLDTGKKLKDMGANVIAIPCITAHYFHDALEDALGIPVLNVLEETAAMLEKSGIRRVGIMATDGTVQSRLLQNVLAEHQIESVLPEDNSQRAVMRIIYKQIKAGKDVDAADVETVRADLMKQGAEKILLACTELSLLRRNLCRGGEYLDLLEVLASAAVRACRV